VELNSDLPFRQVLGYLDKLYEVDIVVIRNTTTDVLKVRPLLFRFKARGYDLKKVQVNDLAARLDAIAKEIN